MELMVNVTKDAVAAVVVAPFDAVEDDCYNEKVMPMKILNYYNVLKAYFHSGTVKDVVVAVFVAVAAVDETAVADFVEIALLDEHYPIQILFLEYDPLLLYFVRRVIFFILLL